MLLMAMLMAMLKVMTMEMLMVKLVKMLIAHDHTDVDSDEKCNDINHNYDNDDLPERRTISGPPESPVHVVSRPAR